MNILINNEVKERVKAKALEMIKSDATVAPLGGEDDPFATLQISVEQDLENVFMSFNFDDEPQLKGITVSILGPEDEED